MAREETAMTSLEEAIGKSAHRSPLAWLPSRQTFWVFLAAVIACVALSLATATFATERNLFNVTRNFAFVAIIALGMTAVIIVGGIDLSVGSVVVLSAMVTGMTMAAGWPIYVAIPLALVASLGVGLFNGFMVAYLKVPPFVVTLGVLSVARSLAMVLSDNKMVYEFGPDHATLLALGGGSTLGIPHPVYILVVLALGTGYAFRWTRWGRHVFAIGGNEQAATMTGIPVKSVKISVYMFA